MNRYLKFRMLFLIPFFFLSMKERNLKKWDKEEKLMYNNLKELCRYIAVNKGAKLQRDTLFKRYVFFDYVMNDSNVTRRDSRIEKFDRIFYTFRRFVDSIGFENLDAKPIRFFKDNDIYKPFRNDEMRDLEQDVFVYYLKTNPKMPLGTVWMDRKSKKLIAWILINQGGYYYYLTFSLLS